MELNYEKILNEFTYQIFSGDWTIEDYKNPATRAIVYEFIITQCKKQDMTPEDLAFYFTKRLDFTRYNFSNYQALCSFMVRNNLEKIIRTNHLDNDPYWESYLDDILEGDYAKNIQTYGFFLKILKTRIISTKEVEKVVITSKEDLYINLGKGELSRKRKLIDLYMIFNYYSPAYHTAKNKGENFICYTLSTRSNRFCDISYDRVRYAINLAVKLNIIKIVNSSYSFNHHPRKDGKLVNYCRVYEFNTQLMDYLFKLFKEYNAKEESQMIYCTLTKLEEVTEKFYRNKRDNIKMKELQFGTHNKINMRKDDIQVCCFNANRNTMKVLNDRIKEFNKLEDITFARFNINVKQLEKNTKISGRLYTQFCGLKKEDMLDHCKEEELTSLDINGSVPRLLLKSELSKDKDIYKEIIGDFNPEDRDLAKMLVLSLIFRNKKTYKRFIASCYDPKSPNYKYHIFDVKKVLDNLFKLIKMRGTEVFLIESYVMISIALRLKKLGAGHVAIVYDCIHFSDINYTQDMFYKDIEKYKKEFYSLEKLQRENPNYEVNVA